MNNFQPAKFDPRLEERMSIIVLLGRRHDQILLSPILNLQALEQLVVDYEAADMPCADAALRKRLEWYQSRSEKKCEKHVEGTKAALVSRLAAYEPMPVIYGNGKPDGFLRKSKIKYTRVDSVSISQDAAKGEEESAGERACCI